MSEGASSASGEPSDSSGEPVEGDGKVLKVCSSLQECWEEGWESCPLVPLAPRPRFSPLLKKEESNRLSQLLKLDAIVSRLLAKGVKGEEKKKKKKGLRLMHMLNRRSSEGWVPAAQVNTTLLQQEGLKTRETNKLLKKLQQENYLELFVKGDKGHLQPVKSSDTYAQPDEFIRFPPMAAPHIINGLRLHSRGARPAHQFAADLESLLQRIGERYLHYNAKASNYRRFHSSEEFRVLFQWSMELQQLDLSPLSLLELKAFLLNLHSALRLHVLGLSQRARDALPDMVYLLKEQPVSSSLIREYLLGAPDGPYKKSPPWPHKMPFDARVPLALFTGTRGSPHFRVYHVDSLDEQLQWAAYAYCKEHVVVKPYSTEIQMPPLLEEIYQLMHKAGPHAFATWVASCLPSPAQRSLQILIRTDDYTVVFTHAPSNVFVDDALTDPQGELLSGYLLNEAQFNKKQSALDLSELGLFVLDSPLFSLKRLQSLHLAHNNLTELPPDVAHLPHLSVLLLAHNNLAQLPQAMEALTKLEVLDVSHNQLTALPGWLSGLPLRALYGHANDLKEAEGEGSLDWAVLPASLQVLYMGYNGLHNPPVLASLSALEQLSWAGNQLHEWPVLPGTLRWLQMDYNHVERMPEGWGKALPHLTSLSVAHNKLTQCPPLEGLVHLRHLDLQRNRIAQLACVASLASLEHLEADGNPLTDAPPGLSSPQLLAYYRDPHSYTPPPHSPVRQGEQVAPSWGVPERVGMIQADGTRFLLEDGEVERHSAMDVYRKEWSIYDHFLISQTTAYYKELFYPHPHSNYLSMNTLLGGMAIFSVLHEPVEANSLYWGHGDGYAVLIRASRGDRMCVLPLADDKGIALRASFGSRRLLKTCRQFFQVPDLQEIGEDLAIQLLHMEEKLTIVNHKVGVLPMLEGQTTEDEFYNNEEGGADFEEFMEWVGDKTLLQNWNGFAGGLDTTKDQMGEYSFFSQHGTAQLMFHVSTYLPFKATDKQQIARKCHLGNDVIIIVWQDSPHCVFDPEMITSQFNVSFVVVRKHAPPASSSSSTSSSLPEEISSPSGPYYHVNVVSQMGMGLVKPSLPKGGLIAASKLRQFLVRKIMALEESAWNSLSTFSKPIIRAREIYLRDFAAQCEAGEDMRSRQSESMGSTPKMSRHRSSGGTSQPRRNLSFARLSGERILLRRKSSNDRSKMSN